MTRGDAGVVIVWLGFVFALLQQHSGVGGDVVTVAVMEIPTLTYTAYNMLMHHYSVSSVFTFLSDALSWWSQHPLLLHPLLLLFVVVWLCVSTNLQCKIFTWLELSRTRARQTEWIKNYYYPGISQKLFFTQIMPYSYFHVFLQKLRKMQPFVI